MTRLSSASMGSKARSICCWPWRARTKSIFAYFHCAARRPVSRYIAEAQQLRIEIAADYLVMAAWLAYLKSRLILPREDKTDDEPSAEEMAKRLTLRLMRLEAMRRAMGELMARARLGQDVFQRGMTEKLPVTRETQWSAEIYDLLRAYSDARRRTIKVTHTVKARTVWSIKDARRWLEKLVGQSIGSWVELETYMESYLKSAEDERTVRASSFGATLEMAREGMIELRQDEPFAPIYMRKRNSGDAWTRVG